MAAASALVGCLGSAASRSGWCGLGSILFTALCSNISLSVRLAFAKVRSSGLQSLAGNWSCTRGHTECFSKNWNCAGSNLLPNVDKLPATLAIAAWAVLKELKRLHTFTLSSPSIFLKFGKAASLVNAPDPVIKFGVEICRSGHLFLSSPSFWVSIQIICRFCHRLNLKLSSCLLL